LQGLTQAAEGRQTSTQEPELKPLVKVSSPRTQDSITLREKETTYTPSAREGTSMRT